MLSSLNDMIKPAFQDGYAVACFNVFGYEDARAVIEAAEKRSASVILAVNLDMVEFMPLDHITGMLKPLADSATVPVCLHLDHNYQLETVKHAVDAGFTSVMYDCSQKPIAENIAGIQAAVSYAHKNGVSVEAEVGSVSYASGRDHIKSELTDVGEAQLMAAQGRPDVLAVSIGNVHRLEESYVKIDFDRFKALEQNLNIPLVIHGTSGIHPEDIQRLAKRSVCKFNIGTRLRQSFGHSLRQCLSSNPALFDRLTIMKQVMPDMSEEAGRMIELLGQ